MVAPDAPVAGAINHGTGDVTYALPSHQANDLLFLAVECQETGGVAAPAGWAHVASSPAAQGSNVVTVNVLWKRATSGAEVNPTVTDPGNHQIGIAFRVRNGILAGNPWDFTPVTSTGSLNVAISAPGGTTTGADRRVIVAMAGSLDTASDQLLNVANATLAGFAGLTQGSTTDNGGGGIGVWSGTRATAGSTGTTTGDAIAAGAWAAIVIALRPAGAQLAASGTVAAVSDGSGDSVRTSPGSGQVDAVTDAAGSVGPLLRPVDAQVDATSTAAGSAGSIVGSSGSAAATSAASGAAGLITPAAGTAAAVSGASGSASPQLGANGQVAGVSGVSGSATLRAAATGTADATTGLSGAGTLRAKTSGVTAAVSAVTGAAAALKTAGAAAFNSFVEVFGSATSTQSAAGVVSAASGVSGSAGIAQDITVAATLDPRSRSAALDPRTWEASLD